MASLNHLPFHQRFPKLEPAPKSIASTITLIFGIFSTASQILFKVISHKKPLAEWTFGYYLFVETMKGFLENVFTADIHSIQTNMSKPQPIPKGAISKQDSFDSSKEVIDFLKSKNISEWPDHASKIYTAHGEWIYDVSSKDSDKVVLFLHGGIYIVGCAEMSRAGSYNLSKASGAKVFGI
jgi:acetyl esterase/lipase